MLFNLIAVQRSYVTKDQTALTAAQESVRFEVYIRNGNALGGPVGSGPGSSLAGWTLIDTADGIQGPVANGISELIYIGPIPVGAGDTVGVALKFLIAGPRYFGTGTPPLENYLDTNLRLIQAMHVQLCSQPAAHSLPRALTGEKVMLLAQPQGLQT
jgi:hypothetical protein